MQSSAFFITCTDGHKMPVYSWLPGTEVLAVLHIAHGMSEYGQRYAPIAEILVRQGFAVYAHDHRGHGEATEMLGYAGDNFFNKQVDDIHLLMQYYHDLYPGKKIFLLGHSMGSFIAQRFFQLYGNEINGLILSATNGKEDPLLSFGIAVAWLQMKLFGARHISNLIDSLSFGKFNKVFKPNRTQSDWLSRSEAEVDKYVNDPKCGFVCTASLFYDFFRGLKDIFKKENIVKVPKNIPVYAFAGDRDAVGNMGKGFIQLIDNWNAAGVCDIEYKLYPGGRHEMLNEINREEVINDLSRWLKKHL